MLLKIGELAKRTGLTVRTLHHYDAIKLLCPSARSDAGYRLYTRGDIERLHRIQALRRLDLSLADIAHMLELDGAGLPEIISQQIASLDRQAQRAAELRDRLKALLERLNDDLEPDLPDWLDTLEMMTMYDKYFTREELAVLDEQKGRMERDAVAKSIAMVAAIRDLMARGVPPSSPEAQAWSKPWTKFVQDRMAGDARLIQKLDTMHRKEPTVQALTGVDGEVIDYMVRATAEYRLSLYARTLGLREIDAARDGFIRHYAKWPQLILEAQQLIDSGAEPGDPESRELCSRWITLFQDVWGTDPEVREKVLAAHANVPEILEGSGITMRIAAFLAQGIAQLQAGSQARPASNENKNG